MTHTHIRRFPQRTGTCTVTEHPDRVEVRLTFNRYGDLGDKPEVMQWLEPIFTAFDSDPRRLVMNHPHSGQRLVVSGDDRACVALVQPGNAPAKAFK